MPQLPLHLHLHSSLVRLHPSPTPPCPPSSCAQAPGGVPRPGHHLHRARRPHQALDLHGNQGAAALGHQRRCGGPPVDRGWGTRGWVAAGWCVQGRCPCRTAGRGGGRRRWDVSAGGWWWGGSARRGGCPGHTQASWAASIVRSLGRQRRRSAALQALLLLYSRPPAPLLPDSSHHLVGRASGQQSCPRALTPTPLLSLPCQASASTSSSASAPLAWSTGAATAGAWRRHGACPCPPARSLGCFGDVSWWFAGLIVWSPGALPALPAAARARWPPGALPALPTAHARLHAVHRAVCLGRAAWGASAMHLHLPGCLCGRLLVCRPLPGRPLL